MKKNIFSLIRRISSRNGSGMYYPVLVSKYDGCTIINCERALSAGGGDHCLFSDVNDDEARTLLQAYVANDAGYGFELHTHFAWLLATHGNMISQCLDTKIEQTDWIGSGANFFFLAYLAQKHDGATWAIKLLDAIPVDERDGLFQACWFLDDKHVQEKLLAKFVEWVQDPAWGRGDGEDSWLTAFIAKWLSEGRFSQKRLAQLIDWHFRREGGGLGRDWYAEQNVAGSHKGRAY